MCTKEGQEELKTEGLSPVTMMILLVALYSAIMTLLFKIEFTGKTLRNILFYTLHKDPITKKYKTVEMPMHYALISSILIVFSIFFVVSLFRLYIRKATKCERGLENEGLAKKIADFKKNYKPPEEGENRKTTWMRISDAMTCYMLLTWIVCAIWTFVFY